MTIQLTYTPWLNAATWASVTEPSVSACVISGSLGHLATALTASVSMAMNAVATAAATT